MQWDFSVFIEIAPTDPTHFLVCALFADGSSSTPLQTVVLPQPYSNGQTFNESFTGLDVVVYNFRMYESVNTSPAGQLRALFDFEPASGDTVEIRDDLYLIADTSPGFNSGASSYVDASLINWPFDFEIPAQGTRKRGTVNPPDDYRYDNSTGTIQMLAAGYIINPGEIWVLHFQPKITPAPAAGASSGGSVITAPTVITTTTTLTVPGTFLIQGATNNLNVNLPALGTISDNILFLFLSAGGNHISAGIVCNGADLINYMGASTNIIYLKQNEELWLFKSQGKWQVAKSSPTIWMVGEMILGYTVQNGTVLCAGQEIDKVSFAALWAWVNNLNPALLVSDVTWGANVSGTFPNKAKFSQGVTSGKFRLPDLTLYFMRPGSNPALFQDLMLLTHKHGTLTGRLPGAPNGLISPGIALIGQYNGTNTGQSDMTDNPRNPSTGVIESRVGAENRPANIGLLPLIRY